MSEVKEPSKFSKFLFIYIYNFLYNTHISLHKQTSMKYVNGNPLRTQLYF